MLVQRAGLDRGAQTLVQQLGFPARIAEHRQAVHRRQQRQAVDVGGHRDRVEVIAEMAFHDRARCGLGRVPSSNRRCVAASTSSARPVALRLMRSARVWYFDTPSIALASEAV